MKLVRIGEDKNRILLFYSGEEPTVKIIEKKPGYEEELKKLLHEPLVRKHEKLYGHKFGRKLLEKVQETEITTQETQEGAETL